MASGMQLCVDMTIERKGLDLVLKLKVTLWFHKINYFIRVTYIFLQCSEYCILKIAQKYLTCRVSVLNKFQHKQYGIPFE
jgi:hypothetical protein